MAVCTYLLNPHWHELWKQEKCLSLVSPRNNFNKTRWWAWHWQGVKLTRLMSIFSSKKVWSFLIKNQLTKSIKSAKKDKEIKVPPPLSCQLRLRYLKTFKKEYFPLRLFLCIKWISFFKLHLHSNHLKHPIFIVG